jgi:AcrR family transcriptional regulator
MTARRSDGAERILREAMRLFADKGYERTSIADIQRAAGLHPGSGALYKHFPSKETVLREGIDRFVEEIERGRAALRASAQDAGAQLESVARVLLTLLGEERDALRIVWRELDPFPDLQARVGRDRIQSGYASAAAWIREQVAAGTLQTDDPEATAVVLMSSVTMYRVLEALFGEPPGRIPPERFLRAWVAVATHGVIVPSSPTARSRKTPARKKSGAKKPAATSSAPKKSGAKKSGAKKSGAKKSAVRRR